MIDYAELIKALRETDFSDGCPCEAEPLCVGKECLILQSADAIEQLSKELMDLKLLTGCCCATPKEETE